MSGGRTIVRVRYPEVDRMDFAHHTAYFVWFEVGRTEWLRERGLAYRRLEERRGLRLPLVAARARFLRPARYDELIEIDTRCELLSAVRIRFRYRIARAAGGETLAEGETEHAVLDARGRPRRLPPDLREVLRG